MKRDVGLPQYCLTVAAMLLLVPYSANGKSKPNLSWYAGENADLQTLQDQQPAVGRQDNQPAVDQTFGLAKAAFSPAQVTSVTLNGQVHYIQGSLDEQGAVTFTANSDGSYRIAYTLAKGPKTEEQTAFEPEQTCSWTDQSGVQHPQAQHNCFTGIAWFLPQVAMFGGAQPTTMAAGSNGAVSQDGVSLLDLRQSATFNSPHSAALLSHLSTVDLLVSPDTHLPVVERYFAHPDNNANVDIPVEVRFSDYRQISGASIPFRIQKIFNGTLLMDITISSATIQ